LFYDQMGMLKQICARSKGITLRQYMMSRFSDALQSFFNY
jgi:hypothetical protein